MDLELRDKRVLLTGGTLGIGRAIAESFLDEGAKVAVCSRNEDNVKAFAEGHPQDRTMARVLDAADTNAVDDYLAAIKQAWGGLDVVIPTVSAMALQGGDESWEATFQTDILATVHLVRSCLPLLQESKGNVVILGSAGSTEVSPLIVNMMGGEQPYGAAKAAIVNYAKMLSAQVGAQGVRVNVVSPGNVFVPGGAWDGFKQQAPELYESMLGEIPMGRMADAREVADCVAYLASARASFITGQNVLVDGGLTRAVRI